jgi:hypothetical protein
MTHYIVDDGCWWDKGPLLPNIQSHDHKPVETGILDSRGRKILRVPEPVGFHSPRVPNRLSRGIGSRSSEGRDSNAAEDVSAVLTG